MEKYERYYLCKLYEFVFESVELLSCFVYCISKQTFLIASISKIFLRKTREAVPFWLRTTSDIPWTVVFIQDTLAQRMYIQTANTSSKYHLTPLSTWHLYTPENLEVRHCIRHKIVRKFKQYLKKHQVLDQLQHQLEPSVTQSPKLNETHSRRKAKQSQYLKANEELKVF